MENALTQSCVKVPRVFEAPLYHDKGVRYVKVEELTKADIKKIRKCIKSST